MTNYIITTEITNTKQAKRYIDFIETQYVYHPNDSAASIVDESGERVYTQEESRMINKRNREIFQYLDDPFDYILKTQKI